MRVSLFITCLTDTFYPRVGVAMVRVLRHFGCAVDFPAAQTCCGQPAFNAGFHAESRDVAMSWVRAFADSETIVSPSASCVAMVREHVPELIADPALRREAEALGERTFEFGVFLTRVLKLDVASMIKVSEPTAFHYPCHARGVYSFDDLGRCLGDSVSPPQRAEQCCGFGGSFSVDLPEISGAMARQRLEDLEGTGATRVVCNEGGCTMQLAGAHRDGRPLRFVHLAELIAESLGLMEPQR